MGPQEQESTQAGAAKTAAEKTARDERGSRATPKKGKRRIAIVTVCALAALGVGGGLTAALAVSAPAAEPSEKKHLDASTEPIKKGPLEGMSSANGTLAFTGSRTIESGSGGIVTALPNAGATVKLGESLFAVDNQPVYLMYGDLPAWRSFESGMGDGPDVTQLQASLKALGYFNREPDGKFGSATRTAIQNWQKATGQEKTGSIPLGRIVFAHGEVRVSELSSSVGAQIAPGGPMLTVTDLTKSVSVDLKLSDQQLGVVGAQVSIDLPNGASTTGTVASVGVPTEKEGASGKKDVVIPVVVVLDDPAAAGALQQASVTVKFPSEKRDDVLSVPVGALLALDGTTFGVEIVKDDGTTSRVPVTTGLFAAGRVEISGEGLKEGQKVVVPTL